MPNLRSLYHAHKDLPEEAQIQAGKAIPGSMGDAHTAFLELILDLLEKKKIDPGNPKSFLHVKKYEALASTDRDMIDLALMNLGHMLEGIVEFRLSKNTPDASPQLATMIDALWQTKSRIEEKVGDVFVF